MKSKALRYASEFIIIVLGITVSLFFDELADNYKKARLETYYLQSLLENLEEDSSRLAVAIKDMVNVEKSSDVLLKNFLEDPTYTATAHQIVNSQTTLLKHSIFAANKSVYEELKSTGAFITLKNKKLKNTIFHYYGIISNIRENDLSADDVITSFVYPRLNDPLYLGNLILTDSAEFSFLFKDIDTSNLTLPTQNITQEEKTSVVNAVIIRKGINAAQQAGYANLIALNATLIKEIRKELSGT